MTDRITVFDSPNDVAAAAVESMIEVLQSAITQRGRASWVLAGGTSPMLAYELISDNYADALDWTKVTVVIGDERFVSVDHPDSNWGTIQPLLKGLGLTVCMPEILEDVQATATQYAKELQRHNISDFDLVWVGVGEDGHTLSLFPDNAGFVDSSDQLVIPVHDSPKPPADRISLSMAAVRRSKHLTIFATGEGKQAILQRVRAGEQLPVGVAADVVLEQGGTVQWLYDQQAFGE